MTKPVKMKRVQDASWIKPGNDSDFSIGPSWIPKELQQDSKKNSKSESTSQTGSTDLVMDYMRKAGVEPDHESYIRFNWPEGKPDPWTIEDEMMLPEEFQIDLLAKSSK